MNAFYTYISRKQIGVIYGNWKRGNLNLDKNIIGFLYDSCAEVSGYVNNQTFNDVLNRVKSGIDNIFNNDYTEAEKEIRNAYELYNCIYS